MTLIDRTIEPVLHTLAGKYPVIIITGPRQSGKTTLCRKVFFDKPYANLESPDIQQFAVSHAVNQSLAGRTALIKLLPFTMAELQNV